MDWEIHFVNPTSQFDQFVDEERTVIQADTEEGARAIVRFNLLGRFGRIREVRILAAPEPVADGAETKEEDDDRILYSRR